MDLNRKDDWHVHLTVEPRNHEMARDYAAVAAGVSMKPIVMDNIYKPAHHGLDDRKIHRELIPSLHSHNSELGRVMILMHECSKFWALSGWIVTRMKLEGRTRTGAALYCEAHVETRDNLTGWAQSHSVVSGKHWRTMRRKGGDEKPLLLAGTPVEWCMYDSGIGHDDAWLNSWGALS